ncbi:hypothetical protein BV25DRAFT_1871013 [Artomyces pyxidatus]|uniref:Uncharacterized protein n=1 Tax=Artomyces pyxidatus TaxID=48021 RepID=A0ACB8SXE8_9AGAM|nr:hypothetical protein BV25DRAFT_1871013 [Artomyces pyxidatus]
MAQQEHKHFDPRIGDDDDEEAPKSKTRQDSASPDSSEPKPAPPAKKALTLPVNLQWIPNNWSWAKLKPVIRSAIAAWACLILMVDQTTLVTMGQAGFLVIIVSMLSPPSDPFTANLERELMIVLFATTAWAWSCLGIKLASLARTTIVTDATLTDIFAGNYVEGGQAAILGVFLFLGSTFFLYIKAAQGPGPFLVATVLGCICLDISITTAALFPYPYYKIGQAVVLPLTFHAAIAIASSIVIFPSSITSQHTDRLRGVLAPLSIMLTQQLTLLKVPTTSPDFSPAAVRGSAAKAEGMLAPLAATARLLKRDISWGRFSGKDLDALREKSQRLVVRANGMNTYYSLIDPTRERFPVTPAPSHPGTPMLGTPTHSRPPSPGLGDSAAPPPSAPVALSSQTDLEKAASRAGQTSRKRHPHFESPTPSIRSRRHTHRQSHGQLLLQSLHVPNHHEHVVGVFESQRYLDLESQHFGHPQSAYFTQRATDLLFQSCEGLLGSCGSAVKGLDRWLEGSHKHRWVFWKGGNARERIHRERLDDLFKVTEELTRALDLFRKEKRHLVLDPYRSAFDPKHVGSMTGEDVPPHRYLFHCYVYQYHALQFVIVLLQTLEIVTKLEKENIRTRLWLPAVPLYDFFHWSIWDHSVELEREDDENPDIVQGMENVDLGLASRRDPDALPPSNPFEAVMSFLYQAVQASSRGNILFAVKAAILSVLLSLPYFFKTSAGFAYSNRFSWAIFMGQLTIARFRGDTTFGLFSRVISTFLGGIVGTVMWYISTGMGRGDAVGLAAVCAVAFPFLFYARLYWPGPPITNIIFLVTVALTIGFSWQNTHFRTSPFDYYGINLAWRRFVLVVAGVVAAFVFSFLPPSTTLRGYMRNSLATTVSEIGTVYCSILSYANARYTEDAQEVMTSLIAIRLKLKRSIVLRTNIIYEFSMRGRWPAERYHKILEVQLEISYLLSHLMSVIEHLEPAWSRAFLRRTRFLDSDFQGDVLAVISMISTSLRTGGPLPQITPCPLFDRFVMYQHGLNVIRQEADDDYGLPRTMTISTLEDEQYLCFCVGVSTAFGIVTRLDRLMVATKELVGEQYHIHGVGYVSKAAAAGNGGVEMGSRTNSLRPTSEV